MAVVHLVRSLRDMLDKVDDTLFALAEKAENNILQSRFFDAMREVRLRRQRMEEQFRKHFIEDFNRRVRGVARHATQTAFQLDADLMLIGNDDLEESLAITSMVEKLKSLCKDDLFALDKRLGFLLDDCNLERHDNPIGPQVICEAAREACRPMEAGIEVKLIILKLFDKLVVSSVPGLYSAVNDYLMEKGLLPQIRRSLVGNAQGSRPIRAAGLEQPGPYPIAIAKRPSQGEDRELEAGSSTGCVAEPISADPGLLATLRSIMTVKALGEGGGQVPGQIEYVHKVLSDLSLIQQGQIGALFGGAAPLDITQLTAGSVNVLRTLKATPIAGGMGEVDDMMIDIVAMMFDYILDDKNLPDAIKVLIGRLQIPIFKVAILDKSFFSRKFHPARKLLNSLAEVALGWSQEREQDVTLYRKVEEIVHRILAEFEDDVEIFSRLLKEFEAFLAEQERQALAHSDESTKTAQGRENLQLARPWRRMRWRGGSIAKRYRQAYRLS